MKRVIVLCILSLLNCGVLGQIITTSDANFCVSNDNHIYARRYLIYNNNVFNVVIFLTEDDVMEEDRAKLLKRKVLHPYGDFRLSMLEWEANLQIHDTCSFIPELFVKVLRSQETFEIIVYSESPQCDQMINLTEHILVCSEEDLLNVDLPNFIWYLYHYNFNYKFSYVIINEIVIRKFLKRQNQ